MGLQILEEENTELVVDKSYIDNLKKVIHNSFLKFILKKVIFYFILFFAAISLAFLIPHLMPGDSVRARLLETAGNTD